MGGLHSPPIYPPFNPLKLPAPEAAISAGVAARHKRRGATARGLGRQDEWTGPVCRGGRPYFQQW